mmetsp:Transcript_26485/g.43302  ORF Transcript_26485/g.43302 Transcript_26485/m.43302 type:complete len:206 (-) Transcript_26485:322-939(-)
MMQRQRIIGRFLLFFRLFNRGRFTAKIRPKIINLGIAAILDAVDDQRVLHFTVSRRLQLIHNRIRFALLPRTRFGAIELVHHQTGVEHKRVGIVQILRVQLDLVHLHVLLEAGHMHQTRFVVRGFHVTETALDTALENGHLRETVEEFLRFITLHFSILYRLIAQQIVQFHGFICSCSRFVLRCLCAQPKKDIVRFFALIILHCV